ncbi:hypothetical protein K439DRAFT_398760 [Ramaria rubella]|nr:hypothetical protein K439DRAFT_398760 [Ramaria rubella]
MSKLHEPSLPPPLSEVTELPVLSLQAPSHTTAPLVVEEVVAPSHVHSCALEVSAPTLISETLHHPYVGPLFSTAPPSPSAVHTMPDEDSKPALGIIPNNYTPHTSRTDLQHSMPSKPPPAISDVMSQAAPPVGSFAAALAAVHRQPLPQHSPLPHRPRSQHHQNRYHEHKPYPVRPTSKAHQLRLSSQPTIPPASKSGSQRLTSTQHDGYPDWRAESEQDQLKPGSQGSFHDEEYPDWRAEAEKDRLKSQEAFCSNESPDWGAPSTKDGSKLSSTKDDGYPDWRAESQRDRSEPKFPDPSSSSNRWRGESTRDRFARGGKWETGHSAEDLGLHTPFSTSMRSERERIQNRDEYLRKVRRKM